MALSYSRFTSRAPSVVVAVVRPPPTSDDEKERFFWGQICRSLALLRRYGGEQSRARSISDVSLARGSIPSPIFRSRIGIKRGKDPDVRALRPALERTQEQWYGLGRKKKRMEWSSLEEEDSLYHPLEMMIPC
jgi:hypothetical protein